MDEDDSGVVIKLCGNDDQLDCVAIGPEEAKHIGLVNNFLCEEEEVKITKTLFVKRCWQTIYLG